METFERDPVKWGEIPDFLLLNLCYNVIVKKNSVVEGV